MHSSLTCIIQSKYSSSILTYTLKCCLYNHTVRLSYNFYYNTLFCYLFIYILLQILFTLKHEKYPYRLLLYCGCLLFEITWITFYNDIIHFSFVFFQSKNFIQFQKLSICIRYKLVFFTLFLFIFLVPKCFGWTCFFSSFSKFFLLRQVISFLFVHCGSFCVSFYAENVCVSVFFFVFLSIRCKSVLESNIKIFSFTFIELSYNRWINTVLLLSIISMLHIQLDSIGIGI